MVCTRYKVECFTGCVNGGIDIDSLYRSEAYGILTGLQFIFVPGLTGNIEQILDNEADFRVYQNCYDRRYSLTFSQDVWDEIIWY